MRRRFSLAVLVSLGLHLLTGAVIVGSSLLDRWPRVPVDIEITGMRLEDLQDLPLGAPASAGARPDDVTASPPGTTARTGDPGAPREKSDRDRERDREKRRAAAAAAAADAAAAAPRPTSVRSYGPEGSRVTALLRIDRLRGTTYAPVVDALLLHLPDRRDLLEGTGIDLYRDIDALLIATPNPLDARVTLLAARHRLTDAALRAALERGARATGRKLSWRTERGRPFAERRSASAPAPAPVPAPSSVAPAGTAGIAPAVGTQPTRDQRLILLAAPGLVVVTPPAYRNLILRGRSIAPASAPASAGAGAGGSADAGHVPDAGAAVSLADGGADGRKAPPDDGTGWALLLRRIDAEDSILPASAVAMLSAVDLFRARGVRRVLDAMPGTRGAVDDAPLPPAPTVMGLPVPRVMTATLGLVPQPFADVDVEFTADGDAALWEQEWPRLRHKLLTNPLVVLSGFSALISRATVSRDASAIRLHIDATEEETLRILEIAAAQLTAIGR